MTARKNEKKYPDTLSYQGGASSAFSELLEYTISLKPKFDSKKWLSFETEITQSADALLKEIASFQGALSEMPFLALVMLWASSIKEDRVFGERYILMMKELLANNLLPHRVENRHLTIGHVSKIKPDSIYDYIRCYKKWSIDKREDYCSLYCQFTAWATDVTFGFFVKSADPDRQATLKRNLAYDTYVKILRELSDRDRILAKIFYLGGSRSLEEVLSLQIKDINFEKNTLSLSQEPVSYPRHVLEDIRGYIESRKSGYVFLGRHGEKIDHTVPYRALKTVLAKLDLDASFTFKDFVKNS